jgi:hypothetical protein
MADAIVDESMRDGTERRSEVRSFQDNSIGKPQKPLYLGVIWETPSDLTCEKGFLSAGLAEENLYM